MGSQKGLRVPTGRDVAAPIPCSGRRRRRAALLFEMVGAITRSFDHLLAAALGECHRVGSAPVLDPDVARSIDHIRGWLLEASSAARRLQGLAGAPAACREARGAAGDLDRSLREFGAVARPLCRADARRRGVTIRLRARPASGAVVATTATRLREVATELVAQASDALATGGVIDVATGDGAGGPWLEVRCTDARLAATTLRVRLHRPGEVAGYEPPRGAPARATSSS